MKAISLSEPIKFFSSPSPTIMFRFFLLLLLVSSQASPTLRRQPQRLPPKYPGAPNRATYMQHLSKHTSRVNQDIPLMAQNIVRIAFYNVNYLRNLMNKHEINRKIWSDLAATVIVLREMPKPEGLYKDAIGDAKDTEDSGTILKPTGLIWDILYNLKYKKLYFGSCKKASFGTVIASRIPFIDNDFLKMDIVNGITYASLQFDDQKVGIFDARLSNDTQDIILRNYIREKVKKDNLDYYIVTAEMKGSVNLPLIPYRSVFDGLNWPHPPFTSWRNEEEDHIFISKNAEMRLLGAYTYFSYASDHLPVMVDLRVPGAELVVKYYSLSRATVIIGIVAILFLATVTGFGMYHWIRSKFDPF